MSYKNIFIKLPVLGMLVSLFGCSNTDKQDTTASESHDKNSITITAVQFQKEHIMLGDPSNSKVTEYITAGGVLDVPPQNLISISSPYGGFLKSTTLLQGKHVHKGDVIATMEHPDYIKQQQEYLESKSQLTFLQAEYERQQELMEAEVNSKKTFQKAKAEYETMKARTLGLRAQLELIGININKLESGQIQKKVDITAPINGYVTKINVHIGAFVNANTTLFELVDTEHLHAELSIFEKDLARISIGQKVVFTLGNETRQRTATVYLIGREINSDRTVRVHCHLDAEDRDLLPGMFLNAKIETGTKEGLTVPNEAVVEQDEKSFIFCLSDSTSGDYSFNMVEVTRSGKNDQQTGIIPLADIKGKRIVIKGAYKILAAMNSEGGDEDHHH